MIYRLFSRKGEMTDLEIHGPVVKISKPIENISYDVYKDLLVNTILIRDIVNIVLDYLNTNYMFNVWYNSFIMDTYYNLFSITKIKEGSFLQIINYVAMNPINIIHRTYEAKEEENTFTVEKFLNFSLSSYYNEEALNIPNRLSPYLQSFHYTSDDDKLLKSYNIVVIILPTTRDVEIRTEDEIIIKGQIKSSIWLCRAAIPSVEIYGVQSLKMTIVYLRDEQVNYLKKTTILDKVNGLLYEDGRIMTNATYAKRMAHARRKFL